MEPPVVRVLHLLPAVVTKNGVWRDQGTLPPPEGRGSDLETFLTNRFEGFLLEPVKPGQRRQFRRQSFEEGVDDLGRSLDLQGRSLGIVDHPANET